jgi:hypothetical protein
MAKQRILICDDTIETSNEWKESLEGIPAVRRAFDVESCAPDDLVEMAEALDEQRKAFKAKQKEWNDHPFDEIDVLVVDYDLRDKDPRSGREIAYLARCFSRCGFIVLLNEHGTNPFDLTLTGYADSFADLNIGAHQLANPGLWRQPWQGFRPWAWPLIPKGVVDLSSRIGSIEKELDNSIIDVLGLRHVLSYLSRPIIDFLSAGDHRPETVTFREFVHDSTNGLLYKDRALALPEQLIARIAAARISHWLERLVLAAQDVLIDAPHLVGRYPSLAATTHAPTAATLNKTASIDSDKPSGFKSEKIDNHSFNQPGWLSRRAWFGPALAKDTALPEVANPWESQDLQFGFCEDISRFLPLTGCRSFIADVGSSFVKRYLVDTGSQSQESKGYKDSLQDVSYQPSARLAY